MLFNMHSFHLFTFIFFCSLLPRVSLGIRHTFILIRSHLSFISYLPFLTFAFDHSLSFLPFSIKLPVPLSTSVTFFSTPPVFHHPSFFLLSPSLFTLLLLLHFSASHLIHFFSTRPPSLLFFFVCVSFPSTCSRSSLSAVHHSPSTFPFSPAEHVFTSSRCSVIRSKCFCFFCSSVSFTPFVVKMFQSQINMCNMYLTH